MRIWKTFGQTALVIFLTLVVYSPVMQRDTSFLFDDGCWLWESKITVKTDGIYRAWFPIVKPEKGWHRIWDWKPDRRVPDYWPLTSNAFWVQWRLWNGPELLVRGLDDLNRTAYLYHRVNVVLHILAALLLWLVLTRLKVPGSYLAALIFALHPLNVPSAATVFELKNILSMPLFLTALLMYLFFHDKGKLSFYFLSLAAFFLALTAKTSVVMLPIILLGFGWWRRGRIAREDLLRTLPFFALSLVMGLMTIWFQQAGHVTGSPIDPPENLIARLGLAGCSVWFYLSKTLLPINLMMIYPHWDLGLAHLIGTIALVGCFVVLFIHRTNDRVRPILFGFGYFVVMLLPVIGLIDMDFMAHSFVADYFVYPAIPGIMALVVGYGCVFFKSRSVRWRFAGIAIAAVVVGLMGASTFHRAGIFKDAISLWKHNIERNPTSWAAQNNFGLALAKQGKTGEAMRRYRIAVRLRPDSALVHLNLGHTFELQGKLDDAIHHYRRILQLEPHFSQAGQVHNNLGNILKAQGKLDDAMDHFRHALEIIPRYPVAHLNLGQSLLDLGRLDEAIEHLRQALENAPEFFSESSTRTDVTPLQGKRAASSATVIAIIQDNLAYALMLKGELDEALVHAKEAMRLKPDWPLPMTIVASVLITHPDPEVRDANKAVEVAERAARLTQYRDSEVMKTLAEVYAAAGKPRKSELAARAARSLESEDVEGE